MTKRFLSMLLACVIILALAIPAMPVAAVTMNTASDDLSLRFNTRFTAGDQVRAMEITRQWAVDERPWVDPIAQQQTTAKWTVLVFVGADNNLEAAALADINEMEYVGSSPDVNVVIEVDRSAEYTDTDGDWTEGRRYYIQQDDDLEAITSPVLENMGEINSGDPNIVADFVVWGIQTYPAERYMLVLWDHGGGWIGSLSDDDSGDSLDLPEVAQILQRAQTEAGIDKFDVLGFDMCLMGQFEVAATIEPYAKYALASEETVPGPGYFYVFVDELIKKPDMDGAELSGLVIDYFMQFYEEWGGADAYGLAAYDLSQTEAVLTAVNQFSTAVQANPEAALSSIADARNNTISYGGFDDPQYYDVWSSVDLYQFGELL
ncbi:MAG TPA: clostripain-related cysteine peptidase, partial [Aggregatilineaceae bacterium]|nr:clostripain-related cysteine peptidase [Aggregatilineaceae bacterium]